MTQGKELFKAHVMQIALKLVFSIIVGQFWSASTFKIFLTTVAAGAFVNFGLYELRKFREYLHEVVIEALEPFHQIAEAEEEEILVIQQHVRELVNYSF